MSNLASTIKGLRREQKLTQKELATLVGCTKLTISRYECGTRIPSLEMLERLAAVFGLSIGELIDKHKREH